MNTAAFRFGYVDTRIGQLHWRACGDGPALLLLHPPPRSSRVFARLMHALGEQGVRAIGLDLPGFGNSADLPPGTRMEGIADAVVDAVGALDVGAIHVFGLHTGNKVAAALAAHHPGRVGRLVLAGMTHSIILDAERRNEAMRAYVRRKPPTDPDADPPAWQDEQIDRLQCRGYDALYEANYAFDLARVLPRITASTLVAELCVPDEEALGRQADALCALMPSARALRLNGNDRELLQQRPHELARALSTFLSSDQEST